MVRIMPIQMVPVRLFAALLQGMIKNV